MVLPFPAQGHVMPLMELSHRLVHHGLQVVFVNTDFNHGRVLQALAAETGGGGGDAVLPDGIHMVSFPDGMGPDGDRTDIAMLADGLPAAMLGPLQEMIRSRKTRWVIADVSMSWALDLADPAAGVRVALFSTFSAAAFALRLHVPTLIEQGILDECGNVTRNETIRLSPKMPPIEAAEIPWASLSSSPERRKVIIQNLLKTNPAIQQADTVICNTFEAIESEALAMVPHALPVGPLEAAAASRSAGQFWPEDPACLPWLDAQARGSVVYVAFGSFTVFDAARFQELAGGLELTGRPFLWVVRPNFTAGVGEDWFEAFRRRVEGKGLVVGWAPQQRVLSHPAVACFLTHCGWNSTMEGVRHGVPLLCWPYFADQFCNQSYVCNVWRNGVKLCADERGVMTKEEIRSKVARLMGDEETRVRAAVWKDAACASIAEGGSSRLNLLKLVDLLTEQ